MQERIGWQRANVAKRQSAIYVIYRQSWLLQTSDIDSTEYHNRIRGSASEMYDTKLIYLAISTETMQKDQDQTTTDSVYSNEAEGFKLF